MLEGQVHGSLPYHDLRALGIDPETVIDFSATVNPYPLPGFIRETIAATPLHSYPETDCHEATAALSAFYHLPAEWIAVTVGMTEIIFALPALYDTIVQFAPTYGDYQLAATRRNRTIRTVDFPGDDHAFSTVCTELRNSSFDLLIICNPNNPTGAWLSPEQIARLCVFFPGAVICIDESYQEMGEACESVIPLVSKHPNLLVCKSLTKPFGIGGIRAAYALSSGDCLRRIKERLLPWGVSVIAQRLIPQLLDNYTLFSGQWAATIRDRNELIVNMERTGFGVDIGRCPFFLVKVGNASRMREIMLREHTIALRDCTSFGMPDRIRIMPEGPENNKRLCRALGKVAESSV